MYIICRVRESRGWEVIFSTPLLDKPPQRVSLNTRSTGGVAREPILAAVIGEGVVHLLLLHFYRRVLSSRL